MISTTQGSSPLKKNKRSALYVKRADAKAKAKAGNIPGNNSNNHSSNAASAVKEAEESRGGVTPETPQKGLNEVVPPSIERMGEHKTLEPLQFCSPHSNRIEQLLEITLKMKNTSPSFQSRKQNSMVARSRGGADLLSAIQVGVKPTLTALPPANIRRCPRAPTLLNEATAEYLTLGVLRRMSSQETQTTRLWSPVSGQRKAESGKIRMITDLRHLNSAWT